MPVVGWLFHGDPDTYRYIPESLERYPAQRGVRDLMERAGLSAARYEDRMLGTMGLNVGEAPAPRVPIIPRAPRHAPRGSGTARRAAPGASRRRRRRASSPSSSSCSSSSSPRSSRRAPSGMSALSGFRAFVAGQANWSKAQKDAVYALARYLDTGDEAYYRNFHARLDGPARGPEGAPRDDGGDAGPARRAPGLPRGPELPRRRRRHGRRSSRRFRDTEHVQRALQIWERGDAVVDELEALGIVVHQDVEAGRLTPEVRAVYDLRLERLNDRAADLQDAFSGHARPGVARVPHAPPLRRRRDDAPPRRPRRGRLGVRRAGAQAPRRGADRLRAALPAPLRAQPRRPVPDDPRGPDPRLQLGVRAHPRLPVTGGRPQGLRARPLLGPRRPRVVPLAPHAAARPRELRALPPAPRREPGVGPREREPHRRARRRERDGRQPDRHHGPQAAPSSSAGTRRTTTRSPTFRTASSSTTGSRSRSSTRSAAGRRSSSCSSTSTTSSA